MSFLQNIINYFKDSPVANTSKRIINEVASNNFSYGFKRGYDAGKTGRLSKYNVQTTKPFAEEIKGDFKTILARARDLELNSSQVNSILNAINRNVIRNGIKFQSKIKTSRRNLNEKLNRDIEENFKYWCRKENCDITGKMSFYDMQSMTARRLEIDGGLFIKSIWNPALRYPLQLQLLEIDLLDIYKNEVLNNGNSIICGVEITPFRKPVAYWLNPEPNKPYDNYSQMTVSVRIPASEIIFIYDIIRIEQLHGISNLAKILPKLRDIMDIEENELVKEKIQTSYSAIITKNEFGSLTESFANEETNADGQIEDMHEAGGVVYLEQGEDVKFPEKPKGESGYESFMRVNIRNFAKADGWSSEQISGDLSQANYSSARTGSIEDEKNAEIWQKKIIDKFCQPIAEWFVDMLILTRKVTAIDYYNNPYKYYEFLWLKPGTKWIDPKKEAEANWLLIAKGLLSRQDYYASLGKDFETEMEQIKFEKELMKKYGLSEMAVDDTEQDKGENKDANSNEE